MQEYPLLKDILEDVILAGVNDGLYYINLSNDVRMYYSPNTDFNGFDFWVLSGTSEAVGDDHVPGKWSWNPDKIQVEMIFHGVAYFDGIRHLYMGDPSNEDEGYIYYPDMKELSQLMIVLNDLQYIYCNPTQLNMRYVHTTDAEGKIKHLFSQDIYTNSKKPESLEIFKELEEIKTGDIKDQVDKLLDKYRDASNIFYGGFVPDYQAEKIQERSEEIREYFQEKYKDRIIEIPMND